MYRLKNKTAIVTGASKGIGASIAKNFAKQGANVVINYNSDEVSATKLVEEIKTQGGQAIAIQANITLIEDIQKLFTEALAYFGKLDILVNNAGVYKFEPITTVEEEEYQRQFQHNVFGTLFSIKESLNHFNEAGGSIINISSLASVKGSPYSSVYSATKGAVDSLTRSLSKELGAKNIKVNGILPGPTRTEGNEISTDMENFVISNTVMGRIGIPQDIANIATYLASDENSWITGQNIVVSGGFD